MTPQPTIAESDEMKQSRTPVHRLIETQARRTPDRLAFTDASSELTYRQLDLRADALARVLRAGGVRRETPVGLYLDRSADLLVALLAVFKSAGTAHLLDPRWPHQRTTALLAATPPRVLLARPAALPPAAATARCEVLPVDQAASAIGGPEDRAVRVPVHPDNLAYVVHTSGSTGEAKPTGITHRSVSHCVATHAAGHRVHGSDRASWLASPGSSAGVGELWPYLAHGASVHTTDAAVVASPAELRDWLVTTGITKAFLNSLTAQELMALPWPSDTPLSLVTVGGDRVARWAPPHLPYETAVSYGSAEANGVTSGLVPWTRRCTSHTAGHARRSAPPPVGRSWPDVRVMVLDDSMRPMPAGGVGELFVAGPELTRGYLDRPALTAERLLPHPRPAVPGERVYRTGDLAVLDRDGMLHHHGRTGDLVKVRGHRVEPGQVQAAVLEHPDVLAAEVVGVPDHDGRTQLVAYVVAGTDGPGATVPAGLRRFLLRRLPEHEVPAVVIGLERLPRNANGKVDRRALPVPVLPPAGPPVPDAGRPDGAGSGLPAGDPEEDDAAAQVRRMWTALLRVDSASASDDFMLSGGTSLLAGRLVAAVRDDLGVRLRLRDFLRRPTLGALIDQVRAGRAVR
ncbi:non-ribosomal peptide synthetase [Streptomyces sp. NBC_00669]|uniref:non-ribosomal peptide synthetase n=1 Tax=Streptomyces sp. NBC_00669 TaxID=2976011 RepID=UPI002E325BC1|nr:non-ribosomal peptide synthetase [Streptomyces sp. NBC_00669]